MKGRLRDREGNRVREYTRERWRETDRLQAREREIERECTEGKRVIMREVFDATKSLLSACSVTCLEKKKNNNLDFQIIL